MKNVITIIFLFLPCILFSQETFDVKRIDSVGSYFSPYGGLKRLTSTKILCYSQDEKRQHIMLTVNNKGQFVAKATIPLILGGEPLYWYNKQDHIIYMIFPEERKKAGFPWHRITLDTNMNVLSSVRLDSTITGVPANFYDNSSASYLALKDSTYLISVTYMTNHIHASQTYISRRAFYRFSQNGTLLTKQIFDENNKNFATFERLMYQRKDGSILWRFHTANIEKDISYGFRITGANFNSIRDSFNIEKVPSYSRFNTVDRKSFISTKDGGFALLLNGSNALEVMKFDSLYRHKWSGFLLNKRVIGNDYKQLIEHKNGSFFVTTEAYTDTTPSIFQDCYTDIGLAKISSTGQHIFTAHYGSGECIHKPLAVMLDNDNGIIVSGSYNGQNSLTCNNTCPTPPQDWLFKVDTLGRPYQRTITNVPKESESGEFRVYPTPSHDYIMIEHEKKIPISSLALINAEGIYIRSIIPDDTMSKTMRIDIADLPSGSYYCKITYNNTYHIVPFLITK